MSRRTRLLIRLAPSALVLALALAPTVAKAERVPSPPTFIANPELAQAPAAQPQAPAAQPKGRVRIQGRDQAEEAPAPLPPPPGLQIDTRQQMRKFLQSITTFARRHNRNFSVVVKGGLELLIRRDPVDETRYSPARTYMRSIDGVMVDGLFFGNRVFGEPTSTVRTERNLRLTEMAKANGLKVFVMDYGTDPKTVDESNRRNKKRGYVSTTLHAPLAELGSLPPYPSRPYGENPNSIISLKNVNTFAYITNSAAFGRADEFAMKMHGTNYDLLIVDVLHGRNPLSRNAVETLKFKKIGARRLVFATINIGTAANYRYYWKANWREGSPAWIKAPVRDDPDRYHVEFWRPEWQRIISGDTKSYVFGLIALGFDGVILEGIEESYRFFEGGGEQEEEEPAPPPPAQAPAATAQ
jgi:endo-alpha-1,4-polygalactosaminidase (GH114 family)